jgi:hypothetical protein
MGRPLGSKNKSKLGANLQEAVNQQDENHTEKLNNKVLAVINDNDDDDSETESESEYDDSDLDCTYEPHVSTQIEPDADRIVPTSLTVSQSASVVDSKLPQPDKATTSKKAMESKSVTTLKLSTVKSGRIKKPTDVGAIMTRNLELFKRALETRQNNQFELLNVNIRGLSERLEHIADKAERSNNHIVKLVAHMTTNIQTIANFNQFNTPLAIKKVRLLKNYYLINFIETYILRNSVIKFLFIIFKGTKF